LEEAQDPAKLLLERTQASPLLALESSMNSLMVRFIEIHAFGP
jgi:hypothetical protein